MIQYNNFFEKFKRDNIYIGEIVKNKLNESIFEVQCYDNESRQKVKNYLNKNKIQKSVSTINENRFLVYPIK